MEPFSRQNDRQFVPEPIRNCEMIARAFRNASCDFHDYAYNFTLHIIEAPKEYWLECFHTMPIDLRDHYTRWIQDNVESCDYEPHPDSYLFGNDTIEYIDIKKKELRPIYVDLANFTKSYLSL